MGLLFREHPKAQPEGGFRRSPGSNLRPLVYKASDLTTAPRRLLSKSHLVEVRLNVFNGPGETFDALKPILHPNNKKMSRIMRKPTALHMRKQRRRSASQ